MILDHGGNAVTQTHLLLSQQAIGIKFNRILFPEKCHNCGTVRNLDSIELDVRYCMRRWSKLPSVNIFVRNLGQPQPILLNFIKKGRMKLSSLPGLQLKRKRGDWSDFRRRRKLAQVDHVWSPILYHQNWLSFAASLHFDELHNWDCNKKQQRNSCHLQQHDSRLSFF